MENVCFFYFEKPINMSLSPSSGYCYIACQIQNCSDKTMTVLFTGSIDRDSLTVQDDYIFLQVMSPTEEAIPTSTQKLWCFKSYNKTVEWGPKELHCKHSLWILISFLAFHNNPIQNSVLELQQTMFLYLLRFWCNYIPFHFSSINLDSTGTYTCAF